MDEGWIDACSTGDLAPEDVLRFDHGDRTFAIYRTADDRHYATDGLCTHARVHLAGGLVMDEIIECPKHNGRFNYKTGRPEALIVIVACNFEGGSYKFLFGVGGEYFDQVAAFKGGDPVTVERVDGGITVNRMPVRKFYTRTINGLVELAENSWKRLTRHDYREEKRLSATK